MTPLLEMRGVVKRLGSATALDGVGLALDAGECVALLGASGSGKSTLVRVLHLLLAPDEGEVLLDGERPRDALVAMRRLGLVQQRPGLLRMRTWENVAYPLRVRGVSRTTAREAALRQLDALGLVERAEAPSWTLSGGEAQRAGLARALVTRPDALLLDEATNQLDPEWVRRVESLLREERRRGCGILLVTHSVAQARRVADRVALLDHGRIIETGPAADVLANPRTGRLRAFVEMA